MPTASKNANAKPDELAAIERALTAAHGGAEIKRLETHISWVLLIEDLAYKVKKPVDLGFCNFTSLERRRNFCHEELRLNRRLAPEIYLDVRAFTQTGSEVRLADQADDGETSQPTACEFAVRMRRFEQSQLLSQIAQGGKLQPAWFDDLAATLGTFHQHAAVAETASPVGTADRIWAPVDECLKSVRQHAQGEAVDQAEHIAAWLQTEFQRLQPWFQQRKATGQIRECHGDLHLGNMVLQAGRIVVFDCIEFNDALRWIDTASDLAFALMDLEDRGAAALAHRLRSAYLEATDDYDLLAGVTFYKTYRALVRAKVAGLRSAQSSAGSEAAAAAAEEFANYLHYAHERSRPTQPWLAIMHGLSGSGKSQIALQLVEQLGAVRARSDVIRKRVQAEAAQRYSSAATEDTYERLREIAGRALTAGDPVVLDATFLSRRQRTACRNLAAECGVPFAVLDCQAPLDALRSRVAARLAAGRDPSEANVSVLEQQVHTREPLTPEERAHAVPVDCTSPGAAEMAVMGIRNLLGSAAG